MAKRNRVLRVPKVAPNLVSVPGLCDEGHIVTFIKDDCVVNKVYKVVVFHRYRSRLFIVVFQSNAADQVLSTREKIEHML